MLITISTPPFLAEGGGSVVSVGSEYRQPGSSCWANRVAHG